jgi:predicted MFS family arabinose efflux permease
MRPHTEVNAPISRHTGRDDAIATKRVSEGMAATPHPSLPLSVYVLGFGIFAMVTSEFQVSGMITVMAADLQATIPQIGYLVSLYAFAMALGGPLLSMALLKAPPKAALMSLFSIFIAGEVLGAVAGSFGALVAARLITGAASGAFFGTALGICVVLVDENQRGWASSIVLAGIMVGTVIGLPLANLIGANIDWRASFWMTAILAGIAFAISARVIPSVPKHPAISLRSELSAFLNRRLWWAFSTSMLIIGATFAGFTYFIPILQDVAGFGDKATAALLFAYGCATVIGNIFVGKLADRHTVSTLTIGLCLLALFFVSFAVLAESQWVAALSLVGIGFVGVTMNPAMVSRVMRTANGRPLVNTVHTSVITLGIVLGAFLGGAFISAGLGLRAPLWIGFAMAVVGLATLIPEVRATRPLKPSP